MKRYFKTFMLITGVILTLTLSSCASKKESVFPRSKAENEVKIIFKPYPATAEKAAGVTVKLPFRAKKVAFILDGATGPLGTGFFLKKESPTEFGGSFIAPETGVYPIKLIIVPEKGSTRTVSISTPLPVRSEKAQKISAEKFIINYLKDYLGRLPSQYKSIKIIAIEKIAKKDNKSLYRITYEASKYEEGRVREKETMFFVLEKEAGGLFISYAGRNPPQDF
jgi:hypothetical protein